MNRPIVVLEDALVEARYAVDSLEAARPGRGVAFTAALRTALERLQRNPEMGRSVEFADTARYWRLARFPYSIVYEFSPARLVVLAIAHERRRPGYWTDRTH